MLGRTEHRKATIAALVNKTDAGARVFDSRLNPYKIRELPAINVNAEKQTGELLGMSPPRYMQTLTIEIDCAVATNTGWADAIDDLCEQVITTLLHNAKYVGAFESILVQSVTNYFSPSETEMPVAVATVALQVEFGEEYPPFIEDNYTSVHVVVDPIDPEHAKTEFDLVLEQ